MTHDAKTKAIELFNQHLDLIDINQTLFRKTIMQALVNTCGVSNASAATHYNNAKKMAEKRGLVVGLGRPSMGRKSSNKTTIDDNDCYTVLEVIDNVVTRTQSFVSEESARERLKERLSARIPSTWKIIKGLGPNVGDDYKLDDGEVELAH